MENYKFRLQKLLDIRLDREDDSKRNFKEAQREKASVEEKLSDLKDNYKKYSNVGMKKTTIDKKLTQNYLNALNININNTTEELDIKRKFLEEKREDLKQKQIDRKTVEVLKDRNYKTFVHEQNVLEQKANDEFALYSFIRKRERR